MYTHVLVPLDGSHLAEEALPYAALVARAFGLPVRLYRVYNPAAAELPELAPNAYWTKVSGSVRDLAQNYLEEMAGHLRRAGLTVSVAVQEGSPAASILAEAGADPSTLIVMTTHGRSGDERFIMGSVTDKVLRAAANPMLIVRPTGQRPAEEAQLTSVVLPLDTSQVAEQALPHATALAKALGLKVCLLYVAPSAEAFYNALAMPQPQDQAAYKGLVARADAYLADVVERLRKQGLANVEKRRTHGDAAGVIVDTAEALPGALVVMATHGYSGVGRWVLGSVTERVMHASRRPVLVVRARRTRS